MEQFWQQDRLLLSAELFGILIAVFVITALSISISRNMQGLASQLKITLKSPYAILIFKVVRILTSVIGIVTLVATLLPGLLPFKDRVDQNLELGGIILFFLWPLIVAQVIIGFLPVETKLEPPLVWGLLIIYIFISLNICKTTIDLLYT